MGYDVTYLYAYDSSESEKKDIYIPCEEHYYIKHYSPEVLNKINKEMLMIFEAPHVDFLPYLDVAKFLGVKTVYEHIDNWDTSLGAMFFSKELFGRFLEDVDMIVATAKLLKEKVMEYIYENQQLSGCEKKVYYIPNAVDSELFDPIFPVERPNDLVIGEKTLVYYGSLWGEWFEWDLVRYVAKNYPQCAINIIGDYMPIKEKIDNLEKNIYFLGLKKQTELPGYLCYSDIAILPFKCCEIGAYVSPLKIFEYISMGKRVLASELPDIQGYPNVFRSNDKEAWLEYVKSDVNLVSVDDFVAQNNWYYCCNMILNSTLRARPKHGKISVITLNRNNKNIIGKCVSSLIYYKGTYNYEIVVVDNDSTDGSFEMLNEKFGNKINLIKNSKNGCSSGRNLGVKNTECDIIVFIDSDQWAVSERWLDTALYILNQDQKIGAVGWGAGWFEKGKVTGKIVDYLLNRGIDNKTLYRKDIAYLATCGMVMRREIFDKIGGFDEFYDPTCFEDTDFSLAIRNEGYETVYCPFINIKHLPHQTTNSGSAKHTELMKRNGDYFLKKWAKKNPKLLKYYL
jgi:GT2 family glycosyltransferase